MATNAGNLAQEFLSIDQVGGGIAGPLDARSAVTALTLETANKLWVAAAGLLLTQGALIAGAMGASESTLESLSQGSALPSVPLSVGILFVIYFAGGFFLYRSWPSNNTAPPPPTEPIGATLLDGLG